MKLIYDGPHDLVDVPDAMLTAEKGKAMDVPDEVAKRLLEQDTWRKADKKKEE